MAAFESLDSVREGDRVLVGGDRFVSIPASIASKFVAGDALIVAGATGELLHLPAAERAAAADAIGAACGAFARMGGVSDDQISAFFDGFATRLDDDGAVWPAVLEVARDLARAFTKMIVESKPKTLSMVLGN